MRWPWLRPSVLRLGCALALSGAVVAWGSRVAGGQGPGARDAAGLQFRVLSGQVRADDDSATVLRRARVTVLGTGAAPAPVLTDQDGRFVVPVPARAYSVSISKPGYAPQLVQGAAGAADPEPLQVWLARGAAINGHVVDEAGAPVADARVAIRAVASGVARSTALVTAVAYTDDRGQFRVGSLPAGSYRLVLESMPSFQMFVAAPPPVTNPSTRPLPGQPGATSTAARAQATAAPASTAAVAVPVPASSSPSSPSSIPVTSTPAPGAVSTTSSVPTTTPGPPSAPASRGAAAARGDGRAGTAPGAPEPSVVQVRAGSEVDVTISTTRLADDFRAASSFVAEFEKETRGLGPFFRGAVPGTGTMSGRVRDPFGRPIVGAIVRLTPVSAGTLKITSSDAGGFYRFDTLPVGSYRVSASKNGWLPAEHGQERLGQPGTIVTVRDRQRRDGVDVSVRAAAVISGSVMDQDGEVMEGLAVHVWRLEYRGGRPITENVARVRRTDDRGRYRIHGLQPGTYYVVASDDRTGQDTVDSAMRAPHSFHPGTSTLGLATPVFVDAGTDAPGTDVVYTPSPTVRVTGRAVNTMDGPANRGVALIGSTRSGQPAPAAQMATMNGPLFEFPSVSPGEYVIQALHDWGDQADPPKPTEFTTELITIGEQDIAGIVLRTARGSTVRGRILQQGGGRPSAPGDWLTVAVADPDFEPAVTFPRPWTTNVFTDLSFEIVGLTGPIRLTSSQDLTPRLWLKSADMSGINVADVPAYFNRRDEVNTFIDVLLAADGAQLAGRVVDGRKEPVASYVVVAFPTSKELWYNGSRYIRLAKPDELGRFTMPMLPKGDFWVVAVDALEDRLLQNPEFLEGLAASARRMSFAGNDTPTLELPLGRLRR